MKTWSHSLQIRLLRSLLIGLAVLLSTPHAVAELMLHPTRVVFDKNMRSAQVELINNGDEEATYRISLVNRRMSETGEFSAVETALPEERFADHMLRFSPRQVTLPPGQGQTVRIMLRKPADLEAGEYRSHLQFDRVPAASGAQSIEREGPGDDEIGVTLNALIGASIPVIVRHGQTTAAVTMTDLELRPDTAKQGVVAALQLNRSGNRSVYGDLTATFTSEGGSPQVIGKAGGVAVYTPNPSRRLQMALQIPKGMDLARGVLRVTYRERPDAGGQLLAEATLRLP